MAWEHGNLVYSSCAALITNALGLQYDINYELYHSCVFSSRTHVILFCMKFNNLKLFIETRNDIGKTTLSGMMFIR